MTFIQIGQWGGGPYGEGEVPKSETAFSFYSVYEEGDNWLV